MPLIDFLFLRQVLLHEFLQALPRILRMLNSSTLHFGDDPFNFIAKPMFLRYLCKVQPVKHVDQLLVATVNLSHLRLHSRQLQLRQVVLLGFQLSLLNQLGYLSFVVEAF